MGATLQTVADAVGVSRSTVSNAYSRPDQLSPELRTRILETASRLGYPGPNPAARSLRSGKAGAIGVLLTASLSNAFSDPYTVDYLRGLAQAAERWETSLLLIPLPVDPEAAGRVIRSAAVDGFCVYSIPCWHGAIEVIRSRGLPIVGGEELAGELLEELYVGIDERGSARQMGTHIADLGHRRVAVLGHWLVDQLVSGVVNVSSPDELRYYVTRERTLGYQEGLAKTGVGWSDIQLVTVAGNDRAEGARAAAFALDRKDRATAILATSDVLALGVLDALKARGLKAGKDVSVAGFDDIPEAAIAGLTTIAQPSNQRGRIAGELLLDPPEDKSQWHRTLPTSLIVRETTGPAID